MLQQSWKAANQGPKAVNVYFYHYYTKCTCKIYARGATIVWTQDYDNQVKHDELNLMKTMFMTLDKRHCYS